MDEKLLQIATYLFYGIVVFLFLAWLFLFNNGLRHLRMLPEKRLGSVILFILCSVAWLAVTHTMAQFSVFDDFNAIPPRVVWVIVLPLMLGIGLLFSNSVKQVLLRLSPSWLIGLQVFRVVIEGFLWLAYKGGGLPVQMTFEGFNFDILVGIAAVAVAYYIKNEDSYRFTLGYAFNILGLLFLITIVSISLFSAPTPFRYFMNEPSSVVVTTAPFIWLPTWVVPSAFILHMLSIRQLFILKRKGF